MRISFQLINQINLPINYDIWNDDKENIKKPLIIISHGYKGFREWGFIPFLAEKLSETNCIAVNIDFSLNGIVDSNKMYFNTDIFAINTVSQELIDLNLLIDTLKVQLIDLWNGEIFLIGHSLGGAVSLITANERNDITGLCLMGTISTLDRNTKRQKDLWRANGRVEMKIPITKQIIWQNVEYLEDKERNSDRFNLLKCINNLQIPISIIHGVQDVTVPPREAKLLFESTNSKNNNNVTLELIPKCNHIFNIKHPFENSNDQINQAFNCIISTILKK